MSVLKIRDDDLLWKYYQKYYTVDDLKVPHPQNLCNYFWTAVFGAIRSFYIEKPLWVVWLSAIVLIGGVQMLFSCLGTWNLPVFIRVFFVPLIFVIPISGALTLASTGGRLKGWALSIYAGLLLGAVIGMFIGALMLAFNDPNLTWESFLLCFAALAGAALVVGVFIGLGFLIYTICKPVAGWRFVKTIGVYLMAVKHRMCPLMEPPQSFKE